MDRPEIVSRSEWLVARKAHLAREKELTRLRDRISAERRKLPWVKVEKDYAFETPGGLRSLGDLFQNRSQLIVYHFMFAPGETEICDGCSFLADHVDGACQHFEHHDVKFVAISRAPLAELETYRVRMGWRFDWVSAGEGDFNYDYHVSFRKADLLAGEASYNYEPRDSSGELYLGDLPGISVFYKDAGGSLFHTYSSYARGGDILIGAYNYLDLTPKGRNESSTMDWVRRHDEYEAAAQPAECCTASSKGT